MKKLTSILNKIAKTEDYSNNTRKAILIELLDGRGMYKEIKLICKGSVVFADEPAQEVVYDIQSQEWSFEGLKGNALVKELFKAFKIK